MNRQFHDLPTTPMPAIKSPRQSRRPWLLAILAVSVLLALGLAVGIVINLSAPSRSRASHAQPGGTVTAVQSGQTPGTNLTTATARAGATSTPNVGVASTPQSGQASTTHGRPHLGGPFSDFVGKYGIPSSQGDANSQEFWVGPDQAIDINVSQNEQGKVTQIQVLGSDTWNEQQTRSYCMQFLPDGATQFSATNNVIKYHSSAGEIDLNLQTTSCSLSFAQKL